MGDGQDDEENKTNSTKDTTQDNSSKMIDGRPCFGVALLHDQKPAHKRTLWSSVPNGNRDVIFIRGSKNTTCIIDGAVLLSISCSNSWILLTYMPNVYRVVRERGLEAV